MSIIEEISSSNALQHIKPSSPHNVTQTQESIQAQQTQHAPHIPHVPQDTAPHPPQIPHNEEGQKIGSNLNVSA